MIVFVIHRSKDKFFAKKKLKRLAQAASLDLQPIFLWSFEGHLWKENALKAISQAEAVIIFDRASCEESDNAKWEIEKAQLANKEIVELNLSRDNKDSIVKLKSLYELKEEFESHFSQDETDYFDLYKLMIESSESLIQRRQKTNAFFIAAIGSLLAIAGLLVKTGTINKELFWIIYIFPIVALLLCNSWRNLIDNYGKLNKAKFSVILRLEEKMGAQIYSAEWTSLGRGLRPKKYQSFTSTEKNVPLYFSILVTILTWIPAVIEIVTF